VGKTTVLKKVADRLASGRNGLNLRGFLTHEIRVKGRRTGFKLAAFGGRDEILSHVDIRSPHRVGRYGVDVAALDRVVEDELAVEIFAANQAPAINQTPVAEAGSVFFIDEIGKMECFSRRFTEAVTAILDSGLPLVATVARKGGGFIARVKRRPDVELWEVTQDYRATMPGRVADWLDGRIKKGYNMKLPILLGDEVTRCFGEKTT